MANRFSKGMPSKDSVNSRKGDSPDGGGGASVQKGVNDERDDSGHLKSKIRHLVG